MLVPCACAAVTDADLRWAHQSEGIPSFLTFRPLSQSLPPPRRSSLNTRQSTVRFVLRNPTESRRYSRVDFKIALLRRNGPILKFLNCQTPVISSICVNSMWSSLYPQLKRLSVWESIQYQIESGRRPRAHVVTWGDSAARSVFEGKHATVKGSAVPVIHVSRGVPHWFHHRHRRVFGLGTVPKLRNVHVSARSCIAFSGEFSGWAPRERRDVEWMSICQFRAGYRALTLAGAGGFSETFKFPWTTAPFFKLSAAQSLWERRNYRMHRRQRRLLELRRRLKRHKKQSAKKRRNPERPRTSLTTTRTLKRSSRMYQNILHLHRAACLTKELASRFAENGKQRTLLLKSLSKDHRAVEQTQL